MLTLGNSTLYRDNATGKLSYYNGVTSTGTVGSTVITTGAWHEIEEDITTNATTGSVAVYLDGTNVINLTSQNTGSTNPTYLGIGDNVSGRIDVLSVDDLSVDTVRPGDSASLNVADSFHVSGSSSFGDNVLVQPAINSTTAFQIQNSSGVTIFNADTSGDAITLGNIATSGTAIAGKLVFADGTLDGYGATLNTATLTTNQTITLPNSSGTVCLSSQNCSVAGSGYLLNQSSTPGTQQTGNFNVSGTGIAGTFDSVALGTLNVGTSNASTIDVGTNASAHTIAIGNGAAVQTITIGSTNTTSATTVQSGSGNITLNGFTQINQAGIPLVLNSTGGSPEDGALFQVSGTTDGEIGIAGSTGHIVNQTAANDLALKSINGNILFAAGGSSVDLTLQSSGNLVLNNGVLVLENTGTAPTEVDGGMYYNSSSDTFQCGEAGYWTPCSEFASSQTGQSNWIDSYPEFGSWYEFGGGTNTTYAAPAGDCQPGVVYQVTAGGTYNEASGWGLHVGFFDNGSEKVGTGSIFPTTATEQNLSWIANLTITCYSTSKVYINGYVTFDNDNYESYTSMIATGTGGLAWSTGSNTLGMGWYWNSEYSTTNVDTVQMNQFVIQRLGP